MVCLTFEGHGVEHLDQESGLHRVQRIPQSERNGRVHTSDVSVVVLDPNQVGSAHPAQKRQSSDFVLEWYSGSGAGGQHRNKHMNCARLTHLPTGLVKTAQHRARSQSQQAVEQAMAESLNALEKGHHKAHQQQTRQSQQKQDIARKRLWAFQRDTVEDITGKQMTCKQALKQGIGFLWK